MLKQIHWHKIMGNYPFHLCPNCIKLLQIKLALVFTKFPSCSSSLVLCRYHLHKIYLKFMYSTCTILNLPLFLMAIGKVTTSVGENSGVKQMYGLSEVN